MRLSSLLLAAALLCSPAVAQSPALPQPPVPSQIGSAKTVFLANAAGLVYDNRVNNYAFRAVFQALSALGRYQFVGRPAEAELSLRVMTISATQYPGVRLEFYDTHTGMLLWTLDEEMPFVTRDSEYVKNTQKMLPKLTSDMQMLIAGKLPM